MKLVIVEDEARNRELLHKMVGLYCPEVIIAGAAASVAEAVTLINTIRPDIILMDIELHPGTCFDIFPQLESLDFDVIFTTAYRDYAIEAIKSGALDYLLKPISKKELQPAIRKAVEKRQAGNQINQELTQVLRRLKAPYLSPKISLHTTDGIIYADVDEIVRCEAKGAYTLIHFKNKSTHMASKTLKDYEQQLHEHHFVRVHNSHLINLSQVAKYLKADGGTVLLKDGHEIPVSASYKDAFLEGMKKML